MNKFHNVRMRVISHTIRSNTTLSPFVRTRISAALCDRPYSEHKQLTVWWLGRSARHAVFMWIFVCDLCQKTTLNGFVHHRPARFEYANQRGQAKAAMVKHRPFSDCTNEIKCEKKERTRKTATRDKMICKKTKMPPFKINYAYSSRMEFVCLDVKRDGCSASFLLFLWARRKSAVCICLHCVEHVW